MYVIAYIFDRIKVMFFFFFEQENEKMKKRLR